MTIEILSSYAGIIEAIVVVVSLVYLAVQMRQNTLMMRAQASQGLANTYNSVFDSIINDSSVWRIGMMNLADLDENDKFKFMAICGQYSRSVETAFSQYKSGALELDLWEGMEQTLRAISSSKSYRHYWKIRSPWHGTAFRVWVEEDVLPSGETDVYVNSLKAYSSTLES